MPYSTRLSQHVAAPRPAVYRALVDPDAIARWRIPDGMTGRVDEADAGTFRVTLRYPDGGTNSYRSRFETLVPDTLVVEILEFDTDDPDRHGTMTMTTTLADAPGGTEVTFIHDGVPDAIPPADNETGTRMALTNLARWVEGSS